jgi:hypothetical protein
MIGANFVAFFTVQGFFIGIIFALLKGSNAEGILSYTLLITGFFYLFSHLCVAFYFRTIESTKKLFQKDGYERELDLFVREVNKREALVDRMIDLNTQAISGKKR